MPTKSKKKTAPEEVVATQASETESASAVESGAAVPEAESDVPVKPARKKRAVKAAAETPAGATPESDAVAPEAEAKAQAADTFDAASEANNAEEMSAAAADAEPPAETEKPKKAKRTKKAVSAKAVSAKAKVAKAEATIETPEPEPQADGDSDDLSSDEDEELEGDEDEDEDKTEQERAPLPPPRLERLQKILAAAGIASRRHAEELITEGRVQVNGKVVTELGSKADAARDHIRVDGKLLHGAERLRYFVLNKPRGFVTTVSDPAGRPTVMGFFAKMNERVYPVGRLDYLSEGLLIMTNDGDLANKLTKAASGVEKTYLVKVSGEPAEEAIETLREGVTIERGKPGEGRVRTAPARIQKVRAGENPWFEVTLIEGRNRELRKMFEEIGHHVEKIRRVGYGPLVLDVEPGQLRELDERELNLLRLAAEGKWKPKRAKVASLLPKEAGRSVDHEGAKRGGKPAFRDKRRPGAGFQDRGRPAGGRPASGRPTERPAYGRSQDRTGQDRAGGAQDRGGVKREFVKREGVTRDFERPRPATGGSGRGFEAGRGDRSFPPAGQERRPSAGGFQARGVDRGVGRGPIQDRGPFRGPAGGQAGDQGRGPVGGQAGGRTGDQGRGFGQDQRRGFGAQGRAPGRTQDRGPNRSGDRGRPQGGGGARPQGPRFGGGNKPFRAKPEFKPEAPRREPDFEERPARPVKLHIEEDTSRPVQPERRPQGEFSRNRPETGAGRGRPETGTGRPRTGPAGRGEQRFGSRPPRPSGGGAFRQDRGRDERGGSRGGDSRGFGERTDRRPPRPEGGGASRGAGSGPRTGFGAGSGPRPGPKPGSGAGARPEGRGGFGARSRDQAGGRSRFGGGGARGGSGSGPRPGNRPGGRGGAGSSGARSGGYGRTPRRPR
jgi:23S rRNA pseudouridine2605 synthase